MRDYFAIGIEQNKFEVNLGTLWRSAYNLGASFIFTIGKRYQHQHSDTTQSWRHIPLYSYRDVQDFRDHIPYGCPVVGIEIADEAEYLESFKHPARAIYLLGPEDGSLSRKAVEACHHLVRIDSKNCVNVAVAGSIVMYDRNQKRNK